MSTLLEALLRNPRAQARNAHGINPQGRCVIYWMQRAQRPTDNPALDAAVESANALQLPLAVFLAPRAGYPNANLRAYTFLSQGFEDIARGLEKKNALLVFRPAQPSLIAFAQQVDPALVIVDENPMREPQRWREKAAAELRVALVSVDADAVVPMRLFPKLEFAARTIRPKIHRVWGDFLTPSREPKVKTSWSGKPPASQPVDPEAFLRTLQVDRSIGPPPGVTGGPKQGLLALKRFVSLALRDYDTARNHPDVRGTSELSAFLHFGHLGPRAIANAVLESSAPKAARDAYLEELIVRREVALNFVLREPNYDRLSGGPAWALKELDAQRGTPRPHLYTFEQFRDARTHDPLWNAGQKEMVLSGRMHGYVRMYWAKKILEWSPSPEEAFDTAVKLNDAYELDGRDPNGYTGIAWAMNGRHDRPWAPRRPVFGTVRFMSFASTSKKFSLKGYVARVEALEKHGARG